MLYITFTPRHAKPWHSRTVYITQLKVTATAKYKENILNSIIKLKYILEK